MKRAGWKVVFALGLTAVSLVLYGAFYAFARDSREVWASFLANAAFVPIFVLMATLVFEEVITWRERRERIQRLHMVIGAFFSEVGASLLARLASFDGDRENTKPRLVVADDWTHKDFISGRRRLQAGAFEIDARAGDLTALGAFLASKRVFLLRLLENPSLLEHESFTDLLWAVFHISEELSLRVDLATLAPADFRHLSHDIQRAYALLTVEWLAYLEHLKTAYPFLYSLARRTNPLDPAASAAITD